ETQVDIKLSPNISLSKVDLSLTLNGNRVPIRRLVTTRYLENKEFTKEVRYVDFSSGLSVIYMAAYNTFLLLDEETYNSLYIQLFVLEEYDKTLFEQVVVNPHAKIYKLKI
ncbi:peptide transporter, partial [Sulfurimonas sp.]|nr:peptide transporter [Sulfurimonas sp.]